VKGEREKASKKKVGDRRRASKGSVPLVNPATEKGEDEGVLPGGDRRDDRNWGKKEDEALASPPKAVCG